MPFNRFQSPAYSDGIEELRKSVLGGPLPSPRFISLLVHGSRDSESPVTLMLAQWGQFIDHDLTATAQPKSINGSVPQCCGVSELHPSCAPIKVPTDDPWLAPLGIRCLEFLRSAPAQRRDCLLSWREQTNQVTSYLDASTIYSSNERNSERSRLFTNGLLLFGRGLPKDDVCLRGAFSNQCIRAGDLRSGEQPGLLAMHHTWVLEHNRIAIELADMNLHWSDEKIYQETRRIIGAMVQHITYREFLPLVLGREVCKLFDLELKSNGYYTKYDTRINPTIANSFSAAAFRFGHSLIQSTYMRSTRNHEFLDNNVTLHEENSVGDIGSVGSLHRLLRGLSLQRAQKRDEFISAELTNHLFQSGSFPFGLDLAAINIQRGRDHGLPAYTQWREPCGLTPILDWNDLERVIGPKSARRIRNAYNSIDDIDLFVGGLAERPVVGGLVGPVFACIIAQQFSNLRRGDRFWYENGDFESSFTPAQLQSIRQVNLAQVICRTLGSGTLQPHIFLPHTVTTNEHVQCGSGSLTPIDLRPWLERDPFLKNVHKLNESTTNILNDINRITATETPPLSALSTNQIHIQNKNEKIFIKLDFPSTSSSIDIRNEDEPLSVNGTVINNKLDLNPNLKRLNTVSNTVTRIKTNTATTLRPTTTKNRLTSKKKHKQSTLTTHRPTTKLTMTTTTTTTQRTKQSKKRTTKHSNRQKHKRDVTNDPNDPNDKARSAIYIQFDKQTDAQKSPFSGYGNNKNQRIDKDQINKMPNKEYIILTPDQHLYDIEIKIKPKQPNSNEKIIVQTNLNENSEDNTQYNYQNDVGIATDMTTKRPEYFYNIAQSSILSSPNYGIQSDNVGPQQKPTIIQITNRPYNGLITKQTTTIRYPYNIHQNDDQTTTIKPYFTTKKPFNGYESNDQQQYDDKPFYAYPSVQNTDTSSYYFANNDAPPYDDSLYSNLNRPTYQIQTNYLNRPSIVRPTQSSSIQNGHNRPPSNSYANNDSPNYGQNVRPSQNDSPDTNYGPTYLDDFSTKPPNRQTTTSYSVNANPNDDFLDSQPIHNGYGSLTMTTKRPQNIVTFYTVMTTKKRKGTKPTRPISYYQPQHDDDDDDDDDDIEDDAGYSSTSIFNPSGVISNIVNTFNDYFNTPTTTRKPYIQHDDIDDDDDFYSYPSIPSHNFPYSRHNNRVDSSKRTLNRVARMSNTDMDYEQSTFPSALNLYNNEDVMDDIRPDGHETITFDHDGYLRPEYMHFDVNTKDKTKNQMHPHLQTNKRQPNATQNFHDKRQTMRPNKQQTRHDKQIITTLTTDNNQNKGQSIRVAVPSNDRPIGLVPINVLTKPERPDNWVMFDALQKLPIPPRLPPLRSADYEKNSNEMPRPINP